MADARIQITAEDRTRAAFESVKRSFGDLQRSAQGFSTSFAAIGATVGAGAFAAAVRSVANYGEELNKASQKTGIAVESLSKLKYAAELADVPFDALQTGLKVLATNVFENDKAFTALGISTRDALGNLRGTEDIIGDLADAFAGMEDGAGKSALAVRLFGRSGQDMIPLLNGGRAALRDAGDELERFGGVISASSAKSAEDFNDNLKKIGVAAKSAAVEIGNSLIPILAEVTAEFVNARRAGEGFFGSLQEAGKRGFQNIFGLNTEGDLNRVSKKIEEVANKIRDLEDVRQRGAPVQGRIRVLREELDALTARRDQLEKIRDLEKPGGITGRTETPSSVQKKPAPQLPGEDKKGAAEKQLTAAELFERAAMRALRAQEEAAAAAEKAGEAAFEAGERAAKGYRELIDPLEKWRDKILEVTQLEAQGFLTAEQAAEVRAKLYDDAAEATENFSKYLKESKSETEKLDDTWRDLGFVMTSAFEDAVVEGKKLQDVLSGLLKDIAKIVLQQGVTRPIAELVTGFTRDLLPGFFGGARAGGGPVMPGKGYLVGEEGPELFVPSKSGTIVPTGDYGGGGGVSVVQNISLNVESSGDAQGDAQTILAAIVPVMKSVARETILAERRPGGALA